MWKNTKGVNNNNNNNFGCGHHQTRRYEKEKKCLKIEYIKRTRKRLEIKRK